MSSNLEDERDYVRHYRLAVKQAEDKYGNGWRSIGREFQAAAIAREILYILSIQDDETPGENIRAMVNSLASHLVNEYNA